EFTGRLMHGRRYSEGLHQAIEAKEGVKVQPETLTMATITLQNYFRLYRKLAGMTGTAATEAEEFYKIYKLDVVVIPTNVPLVRTEHADRIYKTEDGKFRAAVKEIEELHQQGRPVLVGTVSIERSERLSQLLQRRGVPHQVLNAKFHEKEAAIVAQAGQPGAVTIATNMAGRGTDIILGGNPQAQLQERLGQKDHTPEEEEALRRQAQEEWAQKHQRVVELGGLHILGTERHESRRIDNQLRGRSGRQGDPGSSRFYVSLEDDVLRRFGGEATKRLMDWAGLDEDAPMEHSSISWAIQNAQVKVEGYHFEVRKHLVDYDDVMNKHREVIYEQRRKVLSGADLKANIQAMIDEGLKELVRLHLPTEHADDWNLEGLLAGVGNLFPLPPSLTQDALSRLSRSEVEQALLDEARALYEKEEQELGAANMRSLERLVMLRAIDARWIEHLTLMENVREGIGLAAYGQVDPLVAYKRQAFNSFQNLQDAIKEDIVRTIYHVRLAPEAAPVVREVQRANAPPRPREPVKAVHKVGRNDPCPCGSGKKYKKCHGAGA
ncbi:MAG: SEC-C metal-binding domain-containing protein, partial [Chloroflexota bacterium]|nr:SEC-C metal-binding domain-containing protein [Chloroflexota bacterium]